MPSFERPGFYDVPDEEPLEEELRPAQIPPTPQDVEAVEPGAFDTEFNFESALSSPYEAKAKVEACMEALHWPEEEREPFLRGVDEAVANAVIHGNLGVFHKENERKDEKNDDYADAINEALGTEKRSKKVKVGVEARMNILIVKVKDEGDYVMTPETITDPTTGENITKARGRGQDWMIKGSDEVHAGPGEVVLVKYRGGVRPSSKASPAEELPQMQA